MATETLYTCGYTPHRWVEVIHSHPNTEGGWSGPRSCFRCVKCHILRCQEVANV